ncbi:TetR/AcrR family transcriptional regulator [Mycobacterium sp. IDR2000157661]|uniref:TetR/AcrR family transcriptional regulator n=1 Tax=Mycobacterium sp. IDR2000157661 TaxID=2867005 RepID=UPI001EEA8D98|nr:TetR/AcrR family transcriptional regulator [Mycobacterium sp. IDR2000157661]ULE31769.1 TetR/AcrR family transcriptional regulator [Mycobacterium sp. IDR2000157661]
MTSLWVDDGDFPVDTRTRLLDVAVGLISRHSFAGTSLQMIADELGFTKAAIYYHFKTRDQLLIALLEPLLDQICQVIATAENQRTPRTQMDAMIQGFAGVVARNRSLAAVMVFDPSVHRVLQLQPQWGDLIERQLALLMRLEPGPVGVVKATAVLTGLAGAATGAPLDMDEASLVEQLADVGRRVLGLRPPRRSANGESVARTRVDWTVSPLQSLQ